jgi:hypothetical protein
MPSKSQIALALLQVIPLPNGSIEIDIYREEERNRWNQIDVRLRIQVIQEPSSIRLTEDTREPPGLVLEGLYVLDFHQQDVSWLGGFDVEGTGEIVHSGEIDIFDIVGRIIVLDLSAGPVDAFDLDNLIVRNGTTGRNW